MDKKIVYYSRKDYAGSNIVEALKEISDTFEAVEADDVLYMKEEAGNEADLCIVASKHASKTQTRTLTCHSPGNYSGAEAGGNPKELSIAPALYLRKALILLKSRKKENNLNYEVSFECTHHGPTGFKTPLIFIEVGSTIKEWSDVKACSAVAEVVNELLQYNPEGEVESAVAFGGGHYCRKFSDIEEYAIGHICPKYNLGNLDRKMLEQMISKTLPRPHVALAEKKGMGKEKNRILTLIEETGLELVKV